MHTGAYLLGKVTLLFVKHWTKSEVVLYIRRGFYAGYSFLLPEVGTRVNSACMGGRTIYRTVSPKRAPFQTAID
jgi:hypothetical protein